MVVTDGFTGNVALKTMEGFASFLLGNLRDVFGTVFGRVAYLLMRKRLSAIRERLDPSEYGGAPLLGVGGVTIIAHGSSNPRAIRNAIRAAANEALVERVNAEIVEMLARHVSAIPAKSAGKGIRALLDRMRERLHRHPREGAPPQAHSGLPSSAPSATHPATLDHAATTTPPRQARKPPRPSIRRPSPWGPRSLSRSTESRGAPAAARTAMAPMMLRTRRPGTRQKNRRLIPNRIRLSPSRPDIHGL